MNTKTNVLPDFTAPEKKLSGIEKMRANLYALESEAESIISKGNTMTTGDRSRLLRIINVSYHDSGKIEGVYSIDGSVTCEFCTRMRAAAADNELMICGGCYAAKDAWKEAAWRRHKLNLSILSNVLFTVDELQTLPAGALIRINEDGDIANETHARNILRFSFAHSFADVGFWYKNVTAVEAGLKAEGCHNVEEKRIMFPNVTFVQSSVLIGFPARPAWFTDAVFTVYPDAATTAEAIANGAWACNGRKCIDCGYFCYKAARKAGKVVYIAEILRCSKAAREKILKAYNARKAG